MDIERAVLADIRDNPFDDAPRLVYTDWLNDHGDDAAADLIRAEVALSTLDVTDARYDDAEDAATRMGPLGRHRLMQRLLASVPDLAGLPFAGWTTDRGIPRPGGAIDADEFGRHGARVLSALPVTEIALRNVTPANVAEVVRLLDGSAVRGLRLVNSEPVGVTRLFDRNILPRLEALHLSILPRRDFARPLSHWITARPIRSLTLPWSGFTETLLDGLFTGRVRELRLTGTVSYSSVEYLVRLLSCRACSGLEKLDLSECFDESEEDPPLVLSKLAAVGAVPGLRSLAYSGNGYKGEDAASLSAWPRLHALDLRNQMLDLPDTDSREAFGKLRNLRTLSLRDSMVSDWSIRSLDALSPTVRHLNLSGNELTYETIPYLRDHPALVGLRSLDISGLSMHFRNVDHVDDLIAAPFFNSLTTLRVGECTGDGIEALLAAARASRLFHLHIDENRPDGMPSAARRQLEAFNAERRGV